MSKSKALVITRRTTLPVSMQKSIEAAGQLISPHVTDVAKVADIPKLLKAEDPRYIMIDGEYGMLDEERWAAMSKLGSKELRLHLLQASEKDLPESLKFLRYFHALKKDSTSIVIFMEKPSDELVGELTRLGAWHVRRSLNNITTGEASFFQIIQGGKTVVAGLKEIGKALMPTR